MTFKASTEVDLRSGFELTISELISDHQKQKESAVPKIVRADYAIHPLLMALKTNP